MLRFEWDPDKAERNYQKHQVAFSEAATVFGDPLGVTVYDPDHSFEEDCYILIGTSVAGRLLLVAHTERSDVIRIISARTLTRAERKAYAERNLEC
jgi:uncharacterized DUF497 family protein